MVILAVQQLKTQKLATTQPLFFAQGLGIPSWNPMILWYKEIPENSRIMLESILRTESKTTLSNGKKIKIYGVYSTSFARPGSAGMNRMEGFQTWPVWAGINRRPWA